MSDALALTDLSVRRADGETSVRDVVVVVLYSRRSNEDLRQSAAQAIRRVVAHLGFDSLSLYTDYEGNQQTLDAPSLDEVIDQRLLGPLRAPNANVMLSSAEADVPRFSLWYNGRSVADSRDPLASYLTFWIPLDAFEASRAAFLEAVDSIVRVFPTSSGYVNRAFVGPRNSDKQRLARRYLAVDIADPLCVCADIGDKAAGSYWINYLGKALTRLIPLAELSVIAGHDAPLISPLGIDTTRVQLFRDPPTGDVNQRSDVSALESFARLLASKGQLHVPSKAVYFFDQLGMADREAMTAWHRRFLDVPTYLSR